MSLYDDLVSIDLVGPIEAAILKGVLPQPSPDGKVHLENAWNPKRHWVDVKYDLNRRCDVWHGIYFKYYRMIPKGCRNCWKVVVKPRSLKELWDISDVQHKTGRNSKAGLENREYTGNLGGYSAFWYAPLDGGLEGGKKLYKQVCDDLEPITDLKPILKRGCTEMETIETVPGFPKGFYPSSDWDKHAEENGWDKREELLDDFFVKGEQVQSQILAFKTHALVSWIRYAKEHGDPTVWEFMGDNYKIKGPEKYHETSKDTNKRFKPTYGKNNNKPKPDKRKDNNGHKKSGDKHCEEENRKISVIS